MTVGIGTVLQGATTATRVLATRLLADGGNSPADIDPTTGHGPEWGKAAPIGLLTIVLLCVAVYFLVKSLNRNLKKVPASFDAPVPAAVGAEMSTAAANGPVSGPAVSTAPGGDAVPEAGAAERRGASPTPDPGPTGPSAGE